MSEARFNRFEELRREAASMLKLPETADNVVLLVALRLQHERMIEALVAGRVVDAADLLRVSQGIREYAPPAEPVSVDIQLVSGTFDVCPKCGYTAPAAPKPEPPIEASPVVEPTAVTATQVDDKPKVATPPTADIVELPKRQPPSIHDHPDAPLRADQSVNAFVGHFNSNGGLPRVNPFGPEGERYVLTPPSRG